ncbi:LamB/YcsF family protein [Kocuria flava]|uniref:5-oxoprolinase subunit PxpA n=1 Tax=Kocuria flava TaxID=446860 RepID=UPI001FF12D71|nr:5-oxoprolinase subunit PxpA [Kocuria flava]MCJ8503533.1 LamB/YcsF family protein [Kocuria flava]
MTTASSRPTVNSDMGEGIGLHRFGNDPELMEVVDLANVACGFHAGDPDIMSATVAAAAARGVRIGAHPSLPDQWGFGRRAMVLTPEEVESLVRYQVGALTGFLLQHGAPLHHLKPHGSLYGMVARDPALMEPVARVAADHGVAVLGLAGTAHESVCAERGVPFVAELYVDLDYDAEGGLIIQRTPHATDPRAAAERVTRALTTGRIAAVDGTELPVRFDSVCVHSDAPGAPAVARAVREAVDAHAAAG